MLVCKFVLPISFFSSLCLVCANFPSKTLHSKKKKKNYYYYSNPNIDDILSTLSFLLINVCSPRNRQCCLHQFELFSPFHYAVAIIINIGVCSFIKQLLSDWCFFYFEFKFLVAI